MRDPTQIEGQQYQDQIVIGTTTGNALPPRTLPFLARMVLIDNFTNQYIAIPQANSWCPPLTQGWRLNIPTGTRVAQANVATTGTGAAQAATVAGQVAVLTWLEFAVITSAVSQQITVVASTSVDGTLVHAPVQVAVATSNTAGLAMTTAAAGHRFMGLTVRENAAGTAEVVVRAGTSSLGSELMRRTVAASQSFTDWFGPQGLTASIGIFLDRVSGTTVVDIYYLTST